MKLNYQMNIRPAKMTELSEMAKIFKAEFNKKPYNESWTEKTSEIKIKHYLNNCKIRVAIVDEKIIGLVAYSIEPWYNGNWIRINEVVIEDKFQGAGIGKRLIMDVEQEAKNHGVKTLILETYRISGGYGFYKKLNFKESGWIGMIKEIK